MSKYKAISYTRLSYTNEKDNESNSISNQKMLIRDFVKKHSDIEIVSEKSGRWLYRCFVRQTSISGNDGGH